MEIIDVVSSPHTVESGQRIVFSFKIANNVYTLRFSYDVNDEHLEQDVTVRVK